MLWSKYYGKCGAYGSGDGLYIEVVSGGAGEGVGLYCGVDGGVEGGVGVGEVHSIGEPGGDGVQLHSGDGEWVGSEDGRGLVESGRGVAIIGKIGGSWDPEDEV